MSVIWIIKTVLALGCRLLLRLVVLEFLCECTELRKGLQLATSPLPSFINPPTAQSVMTKRYNFI